MPAEIFLVITVEETMEKEQQHFRRRFGRAPTAQDPLFFDRREASFHPNKAPQPMRIAELIAFLEDLSEWTCLAPEVIYARHKLLRLHSQVDNLEEWNAAIGEYRAMVKQVPWCAKRGASAPHLSP